MWDGVSVARHIASTTCESVGWHRYWLEALQWSRCSDLLSLWYGTWSSNNIVGYRELQWFMEFQAKSATVSIWTWFLNVAGEEPIHLTPHFSQLSIVAHGSLKWRSLQLWLTEQNKVFSRTGYQWLLSIGQQKEGASYLKFHSRIPASNHQLLERKKQLLFYRHNRNTSKNKTGVNKKGK